MMPTAGEWLWLCVFALGAAGLRGLYGEDASPIAELMAACAVTPWWMRLVFAGRP
jgi:hypothetical protein